MGWHIGTRCSALVQWGCWCVLAQQLLCCEEFGIPRAFTQQDLLLRHLPAVLLSLCWRTVHSGLKYGKSHYLSIVIPIFFCILCKASVNSSTISLLHCINNRYLPLRINIFLILHENCMNWEYSSVQFCTSAQVQAFLYDVTSFFYCSPPLPHYLLEPQLITTTKRSLVSVSFWCTFDSLCEIPLSASLYQTLP